MTDSPLPAVHFATSLKPHRSLSAEGFRFVMMGAVAANVVIALPLFVMGAWPVFGFMGLDIFLLWWLFQRSYFDARRTETLTLTDRDLVVVRIAPDGEREELRLDSYWLKVEATEERLVLTSRGNRVVIGRFLGPEERLRVTEQLKAAIAAMRSPRYDHAWDE
ncbi:DUF2244 domain-containing protein [Reyranella aquatilis]|uniref:DUF2244 domain-containing protein n=1 Tax=Reyranella aquatilis TaxID=2035356 RepID=A0ABS8KTZ8_9HYPH|nr:DUF2244 domain-containing protein [Reyranella aquatilis]MCC8429222.1 DUF2244 domain-containing protein [Reyranella aquatilis]